jgi:transposase-like protein
MELAPERSAGANSNGAGAAGPLVQPADPEVPEKAQRRQFTASYKLKILRQADACTQPGEVGALLRREGIYSSLLSTWRRQRERGELDGLSGKKPGKPPIDRDKLAIEVKRLRRDNERLQRRLRQAETVIDVQKKVSELLSIPLDQPGSEDKS